MAKPVIKFKTYKQSALVGGKIYGVPNLADPVVANVTMAEVIDYAKLHNYSADTLEALLSQVIAGVADLVARDGRPRNLSDLLKFEPVIKGTFSNMEQTVTNQKVLVRPRLLKEIRVKLDPSDYSWQNENDSTAPKLTSAAFTAEGWDIELADDWNQAFAVGQSVGLTLAGSRLAPSGWLTDSFALDFTVVRGGLVYHLGAKARDDVPEKLSGCFENPNPGSPDEATANLLLAKGVATSIREDADVAWTNAWTESDGVITPRTIQLSAGEVVEIKFTRPLSADGSIVSTSKRYTLR